MKRYQILTATIAASMLAIPANASLIGDTVNSDIQPNGDFWRSTPTQAIVVEGGAPEFELLLVPVNQVFFTVNVEASSFQLDYVAPGGLGMGANELYTLSDLDWVGEEGEIIGFELIVEGGVQGIDESDITFTEDSVSVRLHQSNWQANTGAFLRVDLIVTHPAPGTLALFGVMGLVGRGRRRRA